MKKPELLAPVGGKPHLIAAVNGGADAVYMGGMAFNARIFAENFSDEELPDAINYAHAHGVKVYMTINTLVSDAELSRAFEYCNYIYGAGADGVIIQDMGLARLLHRYLPDLPLHLSTQGTLYNTEALDTAARLGFSRAVPARELSLNEIKELSDHCRAAEYDMDIEVFVHGALCMCYSGQCQMSRVTGGGSGRTGNRGTCAQPCRHAYITEDGESSYALSPKDLCLVERIPELVMSGASSFKIEGRMKSPEYVSIVTGIYRKYIDLFDELYRKHGDRAAGLYSVDESDMMELRQIFNRGNFTEGYLFGNPGNDILSGASPKNQGLKLGRIIAVIDSENKVSEKDERSAARGALRRGRELVCIELDRAARELGIGINPSDGIEFRNDDADYLVNSPVGNIATYIKDIGSGCYLVGDFERGAGIGDTAYKVSDRALMEKALSVPEKRLAVTMQFTAREGQFPVLIMTDVRADNSVEISADYVVERASKAPTDEARIESSLRRLGDTPYDPGLTGIDIQIDDDIMMPVSVVNRMRREASEQLLSERLGSVVSGRRPGLTRDMREEIRENEKLGTAVLDIDSYASRIKTSEIKPVPLELFMEERKEGTLPYILNISKGKLDAYIRKNFDDIVSACMDCGILIGNLGWIEKFISAGVKVYGDYGLNVYNEQARKAYEELGAELYMPSHESCISDCRGVPLMVTEHMLRPGCLTDRKGVIHRVVTAASGDKTLIY